MQPPAGPGRAGPGRAGGWEPLVSAQSDAPGGGGSREPTSGGLLPPHGAWPRLRPRPCAPSDRERQACLGKRKSCRPTADAKMSQDSARSSGGRAPAPACAPLWPPGLMGHRPGPSPGSAPEVPRALTPAPTPPWASTFRQ